MKMLSTQGRAQHVAPTQKRRRKAARPGGGGGQAAPPKRRRGESTATQDDEGWKQQTAPPNKGQGTLQNTWRLEPPLEANVELETCNYRE